MARIIRSLNYGLQFDKDAQHILENTHTPSTNVIALTSTPTITTLDTVVAPSPHTPTTTSDFLQKIGASIINSIQLQAAPLHPLAVATDPAAPLVTQTVDTDTMDFVGLSPQQVIIDGQSYDDLQKQVEYDQFMNEVWIGIVLILILISMVFCFCSCFLYHQFRVWKRNYRTTITQNEDEDNVKISLDLEDPVPEYTLVSGLPSYEAALELLHKNPQSCLIVHPSVFEVFNRNEKIEITTPKVNDNVEVSAEISTPLLNESNDSKAPPSAFVITTLPTYQESLAASISHTHNITNISVVNEKSPQKSQSAEKVSKNNEKSPKVA
ncbi:comm2 [Haematobia irritans]|uniref:comm2 n=1 Tax=Haematobia irritans TaxID=7368 RepID=UPI003F4FE6DA